MMIVTILLLMIVMMIITVFLLFTGLYRGYEDYCGSKALNYKAAKLDVRERTPAARAGSRTEMV